MDHSAHVMPSAGPDWGMIACYLVSWGLAAVVGWRLIYRRHDLCGDERMCAISCLVKFALMPPAMALLGWWGMALSAAAAGVVMFWPLKGKQ